MEKEQVIHRIAINLFENAGKITHGTVSAVLTVHEGRVTNVCHEIKEVIRKKEEVKE